MIYYSWLFSWGLDLQAGYAWSLYPLAISTAGCSAGVWIYKLVTLGPYILWRFANWVVLLVLSVVLLVLLSGVPGEVVVNSRCWVIPGDLFDRLRVGLCITVPPV